MCLVLSTSAHPSSAPRDFYSCSLLTWYMIGWDEAHPEIRTGQNWAQNILMRPRHLSLNKLFFVSKGSWQILVNKLFSEHPHVCGELVECLILFKDPYHTHGLSFCNPLLPCPESQRHPKRFLSSQLSGGNMWVTDICKTEFCILQTILADDHKVSHSFKTT